MSVEDEPRDDIEVERAGEQGLGQRVESALVAEVRTSKDDSSGGRGGPSQGLLAGRRCLLDDAGMATAEYAVATLAACGFAGLLLVLLTGGEVRGMLLSIVKRALTVE